MAKTLGILLAGGQGERLGLGRPKALALLAGRTLLDRAAETLAAACDDVAVVAPLEMDLPATTPSRRVLDPGLGPLGGLAVVSALGGFERALVLGVDFPFARAAALGALAERLANDLALVPAPAGRPQPLVAAYSSTGLARLAASFASGERSVVRAVVALPARLLADHEIDTLPGGAENLFDVDTPDDLVEAERRLRAPLSQAQEGP